MTEYPQVLTSHIKETDYFKSLEKKEREFIALWLVQSGYVDVVEGTHPEEDTTPIEIRVFPPRK
jgi:hypothetical protein